MNNIDLFTKEDYENINLDYPKGYLEELVKVLEKENEQLKQIIDKATNLYLKTLAEQKQVDDLACDMFNILEGNK